LRSEPSIGTSAGPLSAAELQGIDAYWRAANYLSVGQIHLVGNPFSPNPSGSSA
jgi:xylulose-5-phosphate/fructose-6-phosphate phosphoketolase